MRALRQSGRGKGRGSALIEFALSFGVLFALMAGAFEFGYGFFIYIQLQNSVREGARYGSLITYDSASSDFTAAYGNAVRNVVVYGDPAGGSRSMIPNLSAANVDLTVTFANAVPSAVTVSVKNYSLRTIFKTFVLQKPTSTFPYVGRYAPDGM